MDIRGNKGLAAVALQERRIRVRSGQSAKRAKTSKVIESADMSGALPFGMSGLGAKNVWAKLVSGYDATDGFFDSAAAVRRHLAATAPTRDGGRPDAQNVGKTILSSEEVDGFFESGDGHGREFSHELMPAVKPLANYMTLATS